MKMEGDASRGFHRLLSRLDDATRNRYCADALEEDLGEVVTKLRQCAEAVAHARQVDDATKSLIENARTAIHIGSPDMKRLLSELSDLQKTFAMTLGTFVNKLVRVKTEQHAADVQRVDKDSSTPSEETRLLTKVQTILTKQRRSSWLNDALDTARDFVRTVPEEHGDGRVDGALNVKIMEAFKQLRKALVKNTATHGQKVTDFRKMNRKLTKKRASLSKFFEKSDAILLAAEKQLAEKESKEMAAENGTKASSVSDDPAPKSKKRKLSTADSELVDTSSTSGTASVSNVEGSIRSAQTNLSHSELRATAEACAIQVRLLGDAFSIAGFDLCLTSMVDIVNSLSPRLCGEDLSTLCLTLLTLVEKADKIRERETRLARLICLEGLLSILVTKRDLEWISSKNRRQAEEFLANCRQSIELLRSHSASTTTDAGAKDSLPEIPSTKVRGRPPRDSRTAPKAPTAKRAPISSSKPKSHVRFD